MERSVRRAHGVLRFGATITTTAATTTTGRGAAHRCSGDNRSGGQHEGDAFAMSQWCGAGAIAAVAAAVVTAGAVLPVLVAALVWKGLRRPRLVNGCASLSTRRTRPHHHPCHLHLHLHRRWRWRWRGWRARRQSGGGWGGKRWELWCRGVLLVGGWHRRWWWRRWRRIQQRRRRRIQQRRRRRRWGRNGGGCSGKHSWIGP